MEIAKTCTHVRLDGTTCRSLALKDRHFCHYHQHYNERKTPRPKEEPFAVLPFEDTRTILFTIHQLIYEYLNDKLDEKKFGKTIYALQVAGQYANRRDALAPDALAELEAKEELEVKQAKLQRDTKPVPMPAKQASKPLQAEMSLAQLVLDTLAAHDEMDKEEKENPALAKMDRGSRLMEIQDRLAEERRKAASQDDDNDDQPLVDN